MLGALKKKGYRKVLKTLRDGKAIWLTNTGPRDTGQSDFKNRFTLHDLSRSRIVAMSFCEPRSW